MAKEMDKAKPSELLRRPELRGAFMEGATAYAPVFFVAFVGLLSGLVLGPLGLPVWFGVNCLFTDRLHWPVDLSTCRPLPDFQAAEWVLALAWLALLGAGYTLLYRASLRKGWVIRLGPAGLHPGHLFAMVASVATAIFAAAVLSGPEVSLSEKLVTVVAGPFWLRIWWSLRLAAYSIAADRRPGPACAWTLRVFLATQFGLPSPDRLSVVLRPAPGKPQHAVPAAAVVEGPFDAVDARRIADVVNTRFSEVVAAVETRSTLSESEYWRPYDEELGPSGYQSPPIPSPVSIPPPLLWCGGVAVALYFGFLIYLGAFSSSGEEHLEAALRSIAHDIEQMEAGLDPTKETGVDTSFYLINLRDSKDACPALSRDAMARWRLVDERFDDRFVYRVHQASEIDFFGFVIDGVSRACVREEAGRNLREAQYRIASRRPAYDWVEIERDKDWRYVPPRADPRG